MADIFHLGENVGTICHLPYGPHQMADLEKDLKKNAVQIFDGYNGE